MSFPIYSIAYQVHTIGPWETRSAVVSAKDKERAINVLEKKVKEPHKGRWEALFRTLKIEDTGYWIYVILL